jgi:hypothetical protein
MACLAQTDTGFLLALDKQEMYQLRTDCPAQVCSSTYTLYFLYTSSAPFTISFWWAPSAKSENKRKFISKDSKIRLTTRNFSNFMTIFFVYKIMYKKETQDKKLMV